MLFTDWQREDHRVSAWLDILQQNRFKRKILHYLLVFKALAKKKKQQIEIAVVYDFSHTQFYPSYNPDSSQINLHTTCF